MSDERVTSSFLQFLEVGYKRLEGIWITLSTDDTSLTAVLVLSCNLVSTDVTSFMVNQTFDQQFSGTRGLKSRLWSILYANSGWNNSDILVRRGFDNLGKLSIPSFLSQLNCMVICCVRSTTKHLFMQAFRIGCNCNTFHSTTKH